MIFDIIRFNQFALDLLQKEEESEVYTNGNGRTNRNGYHEAGSQQTIGEYLEREGYSDAFRDDYLIPMTASVWSTSPDKCSLEFPAVTLVRFMLVFIKPSHTPRTDISKVEPSPRYNCWSQTRLADSQIRRQKLR